MLGLADAVYCVLHARSLSNRHHGLDTVCICTHALSRAGPPTCPGRVLAMNSSEAATPAEQMPTHRTPEYDEPVVRPGAPDMDASLEPGTVPPPEQKGSTEWYEPEKAAEIKEQLAAEHHNPLG